MARNKSQLILLTLAFQVVLGISGGETAHASPGALRCEDLFRGIPIRTMDPAGIVPPGRIAWRASQVQKNANRRVLIRNGVFVGEGESSKGRRMVFEFRSPSPRYPEDAEKPVAILLHGVGDSKTDLDGLTKELERRGWSTLRPDLLGHGKTASLNGGNPAKVEPIDYRTQVEMVVGLARTLGIKRTVVIGHSMGGGLSMVASRQLKENGIDTVANVPIAPYLSAIDKFIMHGGLSPQMLDYYREQIAKKFGVSDGWNTFTAFNFGRFGILGEAAQRQFERSRELWRAFLQAGSDLNMLAASTTPAKQADGVVSFFNDYFVIKMMEKMYRKYETLKDEHKPTEARLSSEDMALLVKGAIEATIGLRDLDFQDRINPTPVDPTIPTLLFSGDQDPVVIRPQVEDFANVARSNGYDITFRSLDTDHFLPQRHPELLADEMTGFLIERGVLSKGSARK